VTTKNTTAYEPTPAATAVRQSGASAGRAAASTKFAKSFPIRELMLSGLGKLETMNATSIVSIGKACSIIQAMPDRIRAAASELGIAPAMVINDVTYFAAADIAKIGAYLHSQQTAGNELQRRADALR